MARRITTAREQVEMLSPWRTGSSVGDEYAASPRDSRGRVLLWRGVSEGFPHMTFVPQPDPDPDSESLNPWHFAPPNSWDEATANLAKDESGYGTYWGTEGEAKFYAGDSVFHVPPEKRKGLIYHEPHGAMAVQAWWNPEDISDSAGWEDGVKVSPGALGEVAQAHVYRKGQGWVPLPDAPGKSVTARRLASGFDPFKVTHQLRDEFHDWFGQQYHQDPTRYSDFQWGAGMSNWPVIEDFLKDRYPAAHRGLLNGREDASVLLDNPDASGIMSRYDDETGSDIEPYSSGDRQNLGYDPAEVAAGMVLLHYLHPDGLVNGSRDGGKERLVDIYNKRQQMQRAYEQRTGATYWHITPGIIARTASEEVPAVMDLIHWASPYRVQEIMKNGLHAGRGEAGYGAYFTPVGIDYPERSRDPDNIPIHARFLPKKTLIIGPEKNDKGYQKYQEACWDSKDEFGEVRPDLALAKEGYDSTYYKDPWGGHQFIVHDPSQVEIIGPTTREHALGQRTAASDFDDILDLLGQPGRADYTRPSPHERHDPIPGVPVGWERYVTELSGQDPGQAHLHLPVHVLDHYKEYDRDPHSDQAQALSYMLQREGVRNPVHISTDGTHALMHEGNNRLAVAKQLGITHLPVRVTYEPPGRVVRNEGTPVPLEKTLESWVSANKAHLKPFFESRRLAMPALDDPNLTKPTTLYRGVAIRNMSPDQRDRIASLVDYTGFESPEELGKHLQIGPQLIQYLHDTYGGLGRHWTTNPERAIDFAGRSVANSNPGASLAFPVVLKMHWDGTGLDMTNKGMAASGHNFKEDEERVLQPGHRVKIHGVLFPEHENTESGWLETLNPDSDDYDFGHLHRPGYGHPGVI